MLGVIYWRCSTLILYGMSKLWSFFYLSCQCRPTHRYVARAMRPALSWSYINAIIMLVLVTVFSWFICEPASSIFSYTKSTPATNQPTVFLFYNKSALATSHSQSNRASDFGTYVSLLSIWASRDHLQIHEDSLTSDGAPADHFIKFLMDRQ